MTTVTDLPVRAPAVVPRARYRDLLAAEWIKFWSLRSSWGSLLLILLAMVGFSVYASLADYRNWPSYPADRRALVNPFWDAFPDEAQLFVVLAAGSIGVIAIGGEYATGLIRTTFAVVPARRAVISAKIVVVTGVMTVLGVIGASAAFAASQAILSGRYGAVQLDDPGVLRAIAATALLTPLCTLIGLALGAVVRHTAPAIVTAASVLLLLPTAVDEDERWTALLRHAMPMPAWQRLIETTAPPAWAVTPYPATVAGAWTTYAAWAAICAVLTILATNHRDP
ncbi:hypothetical protein [Micromonospora vulcania]|uniref:ABC transporter permease n=1 Tax=Micromonospora vulcania TaxID=1441873 RepID=A0ABW1GZ55_9ACTN